MSVPRIDAILEKYPQRYQPLTEPEFLDGAGGLSGARFWRYRARDGLLVLRAWPSGGPTRAHLEQVHRWLARTVGLGFIPGPIPDRVGPTLQEYDGRFWELEPWLPGEPDRTRPPAPGRLRSAFAALAALHQRLAAERREGVSPGLVDRYKATVHLIQGGLDTLEQTVARAAGPRAVECREAALRWVGLARLVAPRLLDPLRGPRPADWYFFNLACAIRARTTSSSRAIASAASLTSCAMGIDCVAGDLARLIGDWINGDLTARTQAMDAYESVRPLDTVEIALIGAFESASALLIGEHWIRWHYLEDRRFDDPLATTRGIMRGLDLLERLASRREPGRWI